MDTVSHSDTRLGRRARAAEARRATFRRALWVTAAVFVLLGASAAVLVTTGVLETTLTSREPQPLPGSGLPETPLASVSAMTVLKAPRPSSPGTVTVAAVGDMIFDRMVAVLIGREGGVAPLAEVAEQLAAADIAVGNLESPLSKRGTRRDKDYTFRGDPQGIEGLEAAGFDFLSLGNNHALDYGPNALSDTIALLDGAGIGHAGAGSDRETAMAPAVLRVGRASIAFLSFSHVLPPGFIATDTRAGIAQGRGNMEAVEAAIAVAKAAHDYVLVSFHWGIEGEDYATAEQIEHAHRSVDAGADMVLSHHPHVIQALEMYNGSLIAYSTGDFVFDHYSRKTGEAFILEAALGPHGVSDVTVTPVYLDGFGRPEYVHGEEASTILERLRVISARRDTVIEIDGDIGRVVIE